MKKILMIFFCLIPFFLLGCEKPVHRGQVYLADARKAALHKDWNSVIAYAQQFIAIENEATETDKKEVWFLMASATVSLGQFPKTAEIFEVMLQDKSYSKETRIEIYERLIRLYTRMNMFEALAKTRLHLIPLQDLSNDEIAIALLNVALEYQNLKWYTKADVTLQKALEYATLPVTMAKIYFNKATGNIVQEHLGEAEQDLLLALQNMKIMLSQEEINREHKLPKEEKELLGQIYYLLADTMQVQKEYVKSYSFFLEALIRYPNPLLIKERLDLLEKKHAKQITEEMPKRHDFEKQLETHFLLM